MIFGILVFYFFFFLHNSSKNGENDIFENLKFFDPLTYTYFESPCCTVSLYQIL